MKIKNLLTIALASTLFAACGDQTEEATKLRVEQSDFVKGENGKPDSSVQAIFLDMAFSGTLISDSRFNVNGQIEDQLLFTIGHLNQHRSIGRLDKLILSNVQTSSENGRTRINYDAILPVAWGKRSDVPTTYTFKIPVDMSRTAQDAFTEKYSHDCVDFSAHNVDTSSMWYYYRASVRNCDLDDNDVYTVDATVSVSQINTTGKYPEYDKIYQDNVLNVVAIFGKYEDGSTTSSDAGIAAYNRFVKKLHRELRNTDALIEPLDKNPGVDHPEVNATLTLGDGKSMKLTALLVDNVRTAGRDFNHRYEELSSKADLIAYHGHAGLGANIRALAQKGNWVAGQYAVVFMNGCDTYAYVDNALNDAHARVNSDDPLGTKYVDIVTNAMPSYFRQMDKSMMALVKGLMKYDDPQTYEQMFRGIDSSQVVLVSGEEDNTFVPGGSTGNADNDWKGMTDSDSLVRGKNKTYQTPVLAAGTYEFSITGSGDADLYLKLGSVPTKTNYDCRPYKNGSSEKCRVELAGPGVIHVMIDAYSTTDYALVGEKIGGGNNVAVVTKTLSPNEAIPDNDPSGIFSTMHFDDTGVIKNARLDVNIEHTYQGDITITLTKGTESVEVYKGESSQANVILNGKSLTFLKGKTINDGDGDYVLHVVDDARVDTGTLITWSLHFEVE